MSDDTTTEATEEATPETVEATTEAVEATSEVETTEETTETVEESTPETETPAETDVTAPETEETAESEEPPADTETATTDTVFDNLETEVEAPFVQDVESMDEDPDSEGTEEDYKPMFTPSERKIAYLVSGILGILSGVCVIVGSVTGAPEWVTVVGACINMAASTVASMFGVRYVSA